MPPRDPGPLDDLLRAANRGDVRAYRAFLQAVTPILRGIVQARAGSLEVHICEDIVQETLLAIHQKRHTWREDQPVRPWLYAITRHKVVDAFRARGQRIQLPIEDFANVIAAPAETDPTERSDIDRIIATLDPRSARIVRAIGLDGASIADTARTLDLTEGATRIALHRALRHLAKVRTRMIE